MKFNLTFPQAIDIMYKEQSNDSFVTHLLCAHTETQTWATVPLRDAQAVAYAIAFPGLVPVSLIATVELFSLLPIEDYDRLISIILDMLTARKHEAELINMVDAFNRFEEETKDQEQTDGVQE